MHGQLKAIVDLLDSATRRLDALVDAAPTERWHYPPEPGAWSAAQCVAHLNMSSEAYRAPLAAAVAEARSRGEGRQFDGRYRCDPLGWLLASMVGPTPRIAGKRRGRVKAPPPFLPSDDPPRDQVVAEFNELQRELSAVVRSCEGLPIHKVKVPSVFVPSVRFNLYATLLILGRHQHRHLQQAEEAAGWNE
jgi:hypothetical protein